MSPLKPGGNEVRLVQQCGSGSGVVLAARCATSSKFDHGDFSSSPAPWNFNNFFHLGNYIN